MTGVLALVLASMSATLHVQQVPSPSPAPEPSLSAQSPRTRVAGETDGITVRAFRLESPLDVDGSLDEEVYGRIEPVSGFIQQDPDRGEPATEDTQVWILYDDAQLYVSIRALDSEPEQMVANEMRRDNRNIWMNDNVIVALDTWLDRRSAFFFQTNPVGGVRDALILDEQNTNYDWNTVWDVRTRQVAEGWTAEMAIPFRSLRYRPGREQVWGINVLRVVRSKNEFSLLSPAPNSYNRNWVFRLASAATLVGLEAPDASQDLQFRPYAISSLLTDRPAGISSDLNADVGLDATYGITNSTTLDGTWNTDFAQVEIDEQQVNLTRFSLLFPEKRDFFLEGQSVFDFVGAAQAPGGPNRQGPDPTPLLFFSRRIGFDAGTPVPIQGGGRIMGRAGPLSFGAMDIQTGEGDVGDAPSTNFSVSRLRYDLFQRGRLGVLGTYRRPSGEGDDNLAWGADLDVTPLRDLWLTGYYARTTSPSGEQDGAGSSLARLNYDADLYGLRVERLEVEDGFDPGVGLLRRSGFVRTLVQGRIGRRPESLASVRRISLEAGLDRYTNGDVLETRQERANLRTEFQSGDELTLEYSRNFEFLPEPFPVAGGRTVPHGSYSFQEVSARLMAGPQRPVSGTLNASYGGFYTGERTELGWTGRVELGPRFSLEPRVSVDWVRLEDDRFRVTLLGARPTVTLTPRNFMSALVQYNSSSEAVETNIRWRWELEPGTILYVVYTDARDTTEGGLPDLLNRSLAVKFTRLFRL